MIECNVSIVLVNYNSLEDTVECLKSINQSIGIKPFVVVVDNASNNQQEIERELSFYSKLKLILSPTNIGFGRANNIAIDWIFNNIRCEYVFILNNDTLVEKDSIAILEKAFYYAAPEVALITPKILVNDNRSEIWYEGGSINFKRVTPQQTFENVKSYTEFASGCAMFFRYKKLQELKGFDPIFFMYDEDVEMSLQIVKNGSKILYEPQSIIFHKCQGSQTKEKNIPSNQLHPSHPSLLFYLKNTIINRKYILNKHLNGFSKFKYRIYHSIYWLLKCFQFFLFLKPKAGVYVIKYLFFVKPKIS